MNLSYSSENGFGASVGVGYGPATIQAGISERGGTTLGIGFQYGAVNGGLNYSSKSNDVSGNIGLSAKNGSNFALSYSQASGVGANVGYNHDSGVGGNVSWSQHDGFGGGLSYASVQNEAKTNSMAGTGANIAWSERGGTTVNITAASGKGGKNNMSQYGSGGATAGSWSSEGGFKTNSNFLNDKFIQDYLSDAEEHRQSQERQKQNNAQQGADVLSGAGYAGTRREGENGTQTHSNGESGDPVDQRIAQLKKELSEGISLAHDNGTMSDAGNPVLAGAAKELSSKQSELNRLLASKEAGGTTKPTSSESGQIGGLLDGIKNLYGKTKELIYGPEAKPRSSYSDDRSAAQGTRIANETSAYLDYKDGKISKADYERQVAAEKKAYYEATQGDRNKIPMGPGYTDVSKDNLGKLTHLEGIKGVTGKIVEKDGNVYFRTKADGMDSKSIPMELTKITEKPYTKIDPHPQDKFPGAVDLHAPYGSPLTVMRSDDRKFTVTGLRSLSEGGNALRLEYVLGGKTIEVDLRHAQNQFPSYVIDALKANPQIKPTFDVGTVVGWTGVTGQHGIGNDGKIKWDPTDHTHAEFQNSNATQWKDWMKGMGF